MSLPFMPMYWGDYWRDTTHLSDAEHVSYLKLISHYWQHGSLPSEDARLARIAGRSESEWLSMKPMLQAFFKDSWSHARIDRELIRQKAAHEGNSARAKKAAAARWSKDQSLSSDDDATGNASSISQAPIKQSLANANQSHNQNHNHISKPEPKNIRSPKLAEFEQFWSEYPRKTAKGGAEKAWLKAIGQTDAETILAGLRSAKFSSDPQYVPHPATWLNQRRWEDGPPTRKLTLAEQYAMDSFGDDQDLIGFDGGNNG
jgi:uncharacterized protein YdaU (DUF1376 family)